MAEQWNQLTLSGQVRAELTLSRTGQPQDDTFRFAEPRNVGLESAVPFGIRLPEGVVFLPAAGRREGSDVFYVGEGLYWSFPAYDEEFAFSVVFDSSSVTPGNYDYREFGFSVRLITE